MIHKLRALAEHAYGTAIEHGETKSKDKLLEILILIRDMEKATAAKRDYSPVSNRNHMLIVAYYLSEYGHHSLFPGKNLSQSDAISRAANILGVNPNTLRNQRDFFDSHTSSNRQGWKVPLSAEQSKVLESMSMRSPEEALTIVSNILKQQ